MTHIPCGQPVTFIERLLPSAQKPGMVRLMVPVCERCGLDAIDDAELSPGRQWELVDDDVAPETR